MTGIVLVAQGPPQGSDPCRRSREADLAVVIVNYNAGDCLERCLASLEAARGEPAVDVLVIDNDSRDGSQRRRWRHPWARLIENPTNLLPLAGLEPGRRGHDAPYLLLLNPDAEWFRGTLADLVRVARSHPRAGIVGPMVRNPDGSVYPPGARSRA